MILAVDGRYYEQLTQADTKGRRGRPGSVDRNFHERLYAMSVVLGNLHSRRDFIAAWRAEKGKLSERDPGYYDLETSGGRQSSLDAALSESFAESGALYYKNEELLRQRAPKMHAYWKELDALLQQGQLPPGE